MNQPIKLDTHKRYQ